MILFQLQVLVRQYFETFTGLALRALMLVKGLRQRRLHVQYGLTGVIQVCHSSGLALTQGLMLFVQSVKAGLLRLAVEE